MLAAVTLTAACDTLPESKAMLPIIYKCITGNWFEYIYIHIHARTHTHMFFNVVFFLRYKLLAIKSTFLQICFKMHQLSQRRSVYKLKPLNNLAN